MEDSSPVADDRHHKLASQRILVSRTAVGRALIVLASLGGALILLVQILHTTGTIAAGFADWRPVLYAYLVWTVAFAVGQVMARGQRGSRALFLLPRTALPTDHDLPGGERDRKSTRLNSSHANISYAVFCLKKKKH